MLNGELILHNLERFYNQLDFRLIEFIGAENECLNKNEKAAYQRKKLRLYLSWQESC